MMIVAEILVLIIALGDRSHTRTSGARSETVARPGDFLRRFLPRHAADLVALVIGVGVPSADAGWISQPERAPAYGIASLTIIYSA